MEKLCYNDILHYNRFYYGGFLPFLQDTFVKMNKNSSKYWQNLCILP